MQHNDDPRNMFCHQRRQYTDPTPQQQTPPQTEAEQTQTYEQRLEEMKRLAAKYQREGEGQLVRDIVNNVLEQKAAGNLTNEQLVTFAKRVSPLLNDEQRQRLNALVEQLLKL